MSDTAPRERWDEQLPLGRWFEAVASPQPLPAGGRVASLAGAFAAALVEKIGRIVLRSPKRSALAARRSSVAGSVPLHDAEVSAAQFQLTLIEYCVEVIELAQRLEGGVGPALGADLATAGFLARAAAEAAHGNVIVDLKELEPDPRAAAIRIAARAALARVSRAAESGGPRR